MFITSGVSSFESITSLIGLIAIFLLILAAAYFLTKWLGKTNFLQNSNRNITLVESFRINQTSFIQIIKIGSRYFVIGISKDHIEYLAEMEEEELKFPSFDVQKNTGSIDFKDILEKIKKKQHK